jgi:FkbM family methyltransferase
VPQSMSDTVKSFNRRVPYPIRLFLVVIVGLFLAGSLNSALATFVKLRGSAPECPWKRTALFGFDLMRMERWRLTDRLRVSLKATDSALGIQQFSTGGRDFWIKERGEEMNGKELIIYLLSEQGWMAELNGKDHVQPGDIVIDCGAHVGTFTDIALRRGASRVVSIEPDPVNLECLRRNFPREIASGRVIVVPKGVWSREQMITLFVGAGNSGKNSMLWDTKAGKVEVPVTTLDKLAVELQLPRVDFIKMDIEGAEREALRGGSQTLAHYRPRLMLDSYHRPDDMQVLPVIIHQANPLYSMVCGPCEETTFVPHVTYYH